jgi:hypothetical protein
MEAVELLQLEQPSDWTIYRVDFTQRLRLDQSATILSLFVAFSNTMWSGHAADDDGRSLLWRKGTARVG